MNVTKTKLGIEQGDYLESTTTHQESMTSAKSISLLGSLSIGHAMVHWFGQAFPVLLAEVVASLGLGPLSAGVIMGVRSVTGALANVPMGVFADRFANRRKSFMTLSLIWFGTSFFLIGLAPNFALVAIAAGVLGVASSLWHPPALGLLTTRFPERKGFAMAIHGVGAGIGDLTGPITVGVLLLVLSWQDIFRISLLPALGIAVLFVLLMRGVETGSESGHRSLSDYSQALKAAARHRPLLIALLAGGMRSAGQVVLITFLPLYALNDLDISSSVVGVLSGLLVGMSLVTQPILGYLSDRTSRKVVILPAMLLLSVLAIVLAQQGSTVGLLITVVVIGLFMFSLATLFNALVMDNAPGDLQSTAAAAAFLVGLVLGTGTPVAAGLIARETGTESAFYVAAVFFFLSAVLTAFVRSGQSGSTPRFASG